MTLVQRFFIGGRVSGHTIAVPKERATHTVEGDVYTLRLLADSEGRMKDVFVLRSVSDEVAEDVMNGVTKTVG